MIAAHLIIVIDGEWIMRFDQEVVRDTRMIIVMADCSHVQADLHDLLHNVECFQAILTVCEQVCEMQDGCSMRPAKTHQ